MQVRQKHAQPVPFGDVASLTQHITDHTLLCEQCGYILEGLDPATNCPECGKPIAESLPERRTGTPFQQDPTWRGLAGQSIMLARRPTALFGRMRIGADNDSSLLARSIALASLATVLPTATVVTALSLSRSIHGYEIIIGFWIMALCWLVVGFALLLLTAIERKGVTFFSRRRGWRVPKPVAQSICANAAPGWISAGVLFSIGLLVLPFAARWADDLPRSMRAWGQGAAAALPFLGLLAGMLIFETLVYLGVRRCKYANWIERPSRGNERAETQPHDPPSIAG